MYNAKQIANCPRITSNCCIINIILSPKNNILWLASFSHLQKVSLRNFDNEKQDKYHITTFQLWIKFLFKGFESRGTLISDKLTSWDNLLDSISHVGPLTTNPIQPITSANTNRGRKQKNRKEKQKKNKRKRNRHVRSVNGDLEDVMDNINVTIETPLERWRRDASSAPLLTDDHRIAWLCGDPSK